MSEQLPFIGEKLPNGATVIAARGGQDQYWCVVLCFTDHQHFQPYVVWRLRLEDRVCLSGEYAREIVQAVDDYESR